MSRTFNRSPGSRYNSKLDASFQLALQNGEINWPPVLAILTDLVLWAAIGTVMVSLSGKFH
jgi:hypothetical protein